VVTVRLAADKATLDVSWTNYFTECKSKGRAYFKNKIQTGGARPGHGGAAAPCPPPAGAAHAILPVTCSHFTFGKSKKSRFSTILFIYFRLFTLSQKKTNSNRLPQLKCLLTVVQCFLLSAYSTASGACYRRSVARVMIGRVAACSSGLWQRWLNFSTASELCD